MSRLPSFCAIDFGTSNSAVAVPAASVVAEPIGLDVISDPVRVDVGAVWVVAEVKDATEDFRSFTKLAQTFPVRLPNPRLPAAKSSEESCPVRPWRPAAAWLVAPLMT